MLSPTTVSDCRIAWDNPTDGKQMHLPAFLRSSGEDAIEGRGSNWPHNPQDCFLPGTSYRALIWMGRSPSPGELHSLNPIFRFRHSERTEESDLCIAEADVLNAISLISCKPLHKPVETCDNISLRVWVLIDAGLVSVTTLDDVICSHVYKDFLFDFGLEGRATLPWVIIQQWKICSLRWCNPPHKRGGNHN